MLLDLLTIIIHYLYICAKVIAKCCVNFVIIALEMSNDKAVAVVHIYRLNIPFTDNTIYIFYINYILFIIQFYLY